MYSNNDSAGSIPDNTPEQVRRLNQFWKAEDFSLFLMDWLSETLFYIGNYGGVHLNLFFENVYFLSSANLDHGGGTGILMTVYLRFRQIRVFLKAKDPPRWFHEASLGLQIVLAVCLFTSWAALHGAANLDAAKEVSKTKLLWY